MNGKNIKFKSIIINLINCLLPTEKKSIDNSI